MGPKQYFYGGKRVSESTYYRRRAESNDDTSSEDVATPSYPLPPPSSVPLTSSPSSPSSNTFPILGNEDSPSSVGHGNSPAVDSPAPPLSPPGGPWEDEVDIWASVGFVDGIIPCHAPPQMDLVKTIENEVVGFQGDLDASNVPITVQSKILERIFKKKPVNQHEGPHDYGGMGLAQLITLAGMLLYYNYLFYITSNELYILSLGFAMLYIYFILYINLTIRIYKIFTIYFL